MCHCRKYEGDSLSLEAVCGFEKEETSCIGVIDCSMTADGCATIGMLPRSTN